jgi:hypothetical protein
VEASKGASKKIIFLLTVSPTVETLTYPRSLRAANQTNVGNADNTSIYVSENRLVQQRFGL